jgi:hypothetical protein
MALLAAVAAIAVVGFIVLKPDDSKKETSNTQPAATPTAPGGKPSKPSKPAPPPPAQVRVKGGKPDGGIVKIRVSKGDKVRIVVASDVSDEIHVHGYDLKKDVKAGGKVSFAFPAKIDGVFEIELEGRGEQIAELTVNP